MKNFFSKNAVFLSGLLGAVLVSLQEFATTNPVNWPAIAFAAFIAAVGFIANQWRGQGVTITGIIGTVCFTFLNVYNTGSFNWNQFILMSVIAVLSAVAPPAKPVDYEK